MEEEEDDDIYAPEDVIIFPEKVDLPVAGTEKRGDDLEDGEEEGEEVEEDDSDSVHQDEQIGFLLCSDFSL